jgi:tetratricopeptide (TPR) repeat protein
VWRSSIGSSDRKSPPPAARGDLEGLLDAGGGHYLAGRLDAARAAYLKAEACAPDDHRATYSLAVIDLRAGAAAPARERLRRVTRLQPRLAPAWSNLAAAGEALGLWAEAEHALSRVAALDPDAVEPRFAHAQAQITLGRGKAALAQFRRLADEPGQRLRALAAIGSSWPGVMSDVEVDELTGATVNAATPAGLRVDLWFALGAVREAKEDFAAAFQAFAQANQQQRAVLAAGPRGRRPGDVLAEHLATGAHVRAVMTADRIAGGGGGGGEALAPIFIVGMPRSGSTLIEQILSSHPDVTGLGELGTLPALLEPLYPASPDGDFARPLETVAQQYLKSARERGWDGRGRFVDKTLENHLHVGAIRLMFPRAVILHSVRDPVDTCLGIWRQRFTRGAETAYALADIAAEYLEYRQTNEHWRAAAPGVLTDVVLEDLVAQPERVTRWLVTQACGLPWNSACLKFWTTARPVRTASATQVRQPISTSGIGRWRRYEPWLGPLFEALGPTVERR